MDTKTENRGKTTIRYRWNAIKSSLREEQLLVRFCSFLLNILAFLVIILPALVYCPCARFLNIAGKGMSKIYSDFKTDGMGNFIHLIASVIAFILYLCLGLAFLVLGLPFLVLYWSYRAIDELSKHPVFKILLLLVVLGGIAFYVFKYASHRVEQSHVDATTEMAR